MRRHVFTLLLAWVAALACAQAAQAGTLPSSDFQETTALGGYSGFTNPTVVAFAPNDKVFVAEKSGLIKVFDDIDDSTPTAVADLSAEVYNFWDRGLLGLAVDPQYPADPYLYALYTRDALPGGEPQEWGSPGVLGDPCPAPPDGPGATGDGCVASARLARLTLNSGDVMTGSPTPLITDWCQQYPSHSIGDLNFGPDGALYISGGDGAAWHLATDYGQDGDPVNPCGDPPGGAPGTVLTPPTAEGGALRSQDIRTTSDPTGLNGSILRVNPDTGAGLPGNPYSGSSDANARRIVAFGQRNPFRFTLRPGTEEVWAGDVGRSSWEEINRVVDPTDSEADNLGWPCYEGVGQQDRFEDANLDLCDDLYDLHALDPDAVIEPYFTYFHDTPIVSGETCPFGSSSISGLDFYTSGPFPNSYDGALFFADYSRDCIWAMLPGGNGLPDPSQIQNFDVGAANPVDLEIGPDGDLFYVDFGNGEIRKVTHTVGNQPPTAVATATPENGAGPLEVELDASESTDPDGDSPLGFAWDLDEDGEFDDSTQATLMHTFTQLGTHDPAVRVTDPDGASGTDSVSIQVGNSPPIAQIDTPTALDDWAVDETVDFSASAEDAQETLPPSAFDWALIINHCPSNCHEHALQEFNNVMGGSFDAPNHEYPSSLRLDLTVTDAGGLTDTESVEIDPRTVELTLGSVPAGIELALNDEDPSPAPFNRTVIEDSQNELNAPADQVLGGQTYYFGSWSDGGAATHNITADQDTTLVASYLDSPPPAAPQITDIDPDSPANDNDPEVRGSTGAGAPIQVKVYKNASCSGAPDATGTVAQFTGAGITVNVPGDATTALSARASDALSHDSACSKTIDYVEDSTGPETVIAGAPPARIRALPRRRAAQAGRPRGGTLTLSFYATEPVPGFQCRLDKRAYGPCSSPLRLTRLKRGAHTFLVRAVDAVGNVDATPASHRFRVAEKRKRRGTGA